MGQISHIWLSVQLQEMRSMSPTHDSRCTDEGIRCRANSLRPHFRRIASIVARQSGVAHCAELEQIAESIWVAEIGNGRQVSDSMLCQCIHVAWSRRGADATTSPVPAPSVST